MEKQKYNNFLFQHNTQYTIPLEKLIINLMFANAEILSQHPTRVGFFLSLIGQLIVLDNKQQEITNKKVKKNK